MELHGKKKKRRKNYRWIDERKSSSSDVYKKWRHDHPVRHLFQHLVGVFLFFFIFPWLSIVFYLIFWNLFFYCSNVVFLFRLSYLFFFWICLALKSSPVQSVRREDPTKSSAAGQHKNIEKRTCRAEMTKFVPKRARAAHNFYTRVKTFWKI